MFWLCLTLRLISCHFSCVFHTFIFIWQKFKFHNPVFTIIPKFHGSNWISQYIGLLWVKNGLPNNLNFLISLCISCVVVLLQFCYKKSKATYSSTLHWFKANANMSVAVGWWRPSLDCTRPWWCWSISLATPGSGTQTTSPCSWTRWGPRIRRYLTLTSGSYTGQNIWRITAWAPRSMFLMKSCQDSQRHANTWTSCGIFATLSTLFWWF